MQIPRIHTATPITPESLLELDESARRHVAQVLRMRVSAPLTLFDGTGGEFPATIHTIEKRSLTVQTGKRVERERESPLAIHLFQGVSKGERMDYVIQKATECGVSEITPLLCERTVVRLDSRRMERKLDHWRKVAISACEQCGRNRVPPIHPPLSYSTFLSSEQVESGVVLDAASERRVSELELSKPNGGRIGIITGPEGGLTRQEINSAVESGYHGVQVGPRILRTETASVVAITIMQTLWGDL